MKDFDFFEEIIILVAIYLYRLDGLSGDVSPPAYQSYASTGRGQQAMIREELIDEAARIVSSAVTSRSGAEQSGAERQHAGGDMKVLINGAPTVQGEFRI